MGDSVREVNEDMVMARGVSPSMDVQTTTGFGRSRIMERTCSDSEAEEVGSTVGEVLMAAEGCCDGVGVDVAKLLLGVALREKR